MMRLLGVCSIVFAAACTTGDVPPPPNGRICSTTYTVSGSFVPGTAPPMNWTGCWPVGTWTFAAAQADNDCGTPGMVLPQYQILGVQVLDENGDPNYSMSYLTDPTVMNICKVSEGGSGLCEGELDLYSTDGTQVMLLKPELNADNTVTGDGEYSLYGSDQWPYGTGSGG